MKKLGLLLISAMAVGCATQKYGFRPVGSVASAEAGYPASHYQVPPQSPRGELYVTSFGTREVDGGGGRTQLIHVRVALGNQNADSDWVIDPAKQVLMGPGAAPQRPDFMEVDGRHDGNTTVARGQRRVFDFYYRMPGGAADASHLNGFEFQWQVDSGSQPVIAERTPFTREPFREAGSEGPRTNVAVVAAPWWAYGYGSGWWGGFGYGLYGPWGYPYYGYGYGPYVGVGVGVGYGFGGRYGGGYRPYYGGGHYGGGGFRGGGGFGRGGGGVRAPAIRGR